MLNQLHESGLTERLRSIGLLRPYASPEEILSYQRPDRVSGALTFVVCLLPLIAAAIGVLVACAPVEDLKDWADGIAPDGVATQFPVERLAKIQPRALFASLGWLCLGAVAFYLRYRFPGPVRTGLREILSIAAWSRQRVRDLPRIDRAHAALLAFMTLSVVVATWPLLDGPARTDEASTYMNFIAKPPIYIVCSYSRVNNHVLHNLVAWLSIQVFGDGLVPLRLTSFLCGVLLIPLTYVAVRRHHRRGAALIAAGLLASSAILIDGATNARGYQMLLVALVALLTVLPSMVRGEQWSWLAFVIVISAGFWTVPIMVYPAILAGLWLCAARYWDQPKNPRTFLLRLGVATASVIVIVVSLYSPAQVVSGAAEVLVNQAKWGANPTFLGALSDLSWRVGELQPMWGFGRPDWIEWVMTAGLIAFPFVARKTSRYGPRLMLTAAGSLLIVLAATKTSPPFWSLSFVFVFFAIFAAAGLTGLVALLRLPTPARQWSEVGIAAVLFLASLGGPLDTTAMRNAPWFVGFRDAVEVTEFVGDDLLAGAKIDEGFTGGSSLKFHLWRFDPRLTEELRVRHVEEEVGDTVFLVIPPTTSAERAERRLAEWRTRGFELSGEPVKCGASRVAVLKRSP
jgi:hypothetical protein